MKVRHLRTLGDLFEEDKYYLKTRRVRVQRPELVYLISEGGPAWDLPSYSQKTLEIPTRKEDAEAKGWILGESSLGKCTEWNLSAVNSATTWKDAHLKMGAEHFMIVLEQIEGEEVGVLYRRHR